jgi:predicted transcriptional regulator
MRQNITLALDQALIGKLKTLAADRQTSVSGLLRAELERLVERNERFEQARRNALADLDAGFELGFRADGRPSARDALHDREALR